MAAASGATAQRPRLLVIGSDRIVPGMESLTGLPDFDVLFVSSHEEALVAAAKDRFALILLAKDSPGIDATSLTAALKRTSANPQTPVIFTASTGPVAGTIAVPYFLDVEGELASRYRAHNWLNTPLGAPETWPTELKTSVGLILNSSFPMFISWGPERIFLYNDAYAPILGNKHPQALGRPFNEVWVEIWKDLLPLVESVDAGKPVFLNELRLIMDRKGHPEVTYFTFSYSPIHDFSGKVAGLFCACVEMTEKRLAAESALENERRLRTLADSIPQLVWVTNAEGKSIFFNRRWTEYTGVDVDSPKAWADFIHPQDVVKAKELWNRSVATGTPYHVEYRLKDVRTGEYRWFRSQGKPQLDQDGQLSRWYGTCTDIELEKRAQLEFERNVDSSPAILWITEPDGRCTYLSRQWTSFTGQPDPEGLGFGWVDRVHPDDRDAAHVAFMKANEAGKSYSIECRMMTSSGQYRWVVDAANPRFDADGNFLGMAGTVFDIHDRIVAAQKLAETAVDLKLKSDALENSLAGFDIVDEHGRLVYVNPAYLKMWGFDSPEEVLGKSPADHCLDPMTPIQIITQIKATGECDIEFVAKRKDGSTFDVRMLAFRTYDVNGREIYPTTSVDITAQKRAQSRVDRALREAEQSREELRAAKEEAERANDLKSAFLANMSHEIRTPLGAMIGFADLLRDPGLTPVERANYIDILSRNGESLGIIINDILDLSKVEAGHLILEYTEVDARRIIEDVVSLLRVNAKEKDLALIFSASPSLPATITSDPMRIRQVLLNLIGNAIKFTQFGSVSIHAYGCKTDDGLDAACFEIIDTGIGIPEEQKDRVFEMFVQADGTMTRRFGGTGLGLALARRLARALGGEVEITKTSPGKGTSFLFKVEDQPDRRNSEIRVSRQEHKIKTFTEGEALQGIRVLVVDDSPDNQQLIWHYLKQQGALIDTAENGLLGVKKALAEEFDIVLMDIQMPEMDGYTATQKLRTEGFRKPIIALTAHAMGEVRQKSMNIGCSDHLTKPINPKLLISTIIEHIRN